MYAGMEKHRHTRIHRIKCKHAHTQRDIQTHRHTNTHRHPCSLQELLRTEEPGMCSLGQGLHTSHAWILFTVAEIP